MIQEQTSFFLCPTFFVCLFDVAVCAISRQGFYVFLDLFFLFKQIIILPSSSPPPSCRSHSFDPSSSFALPSVSVSRPFFRYGLFFFFLALFWWNQYRLGFFLVRFLFGISITITILFHFLFFVYFLSSVLAQSLSFDCFVSWMLSPSFMLITSYTTRSAPELSSFYHKKKNQAKVCGCLLLFSLWPLPLPSLFFFSLGCSISFFILT